MGKNCWEIKPCPRDLFEACAHNKRQELCPLDCHYAHCNKPSYKFVENFMDFLKEKQDPPAKQICWSCQFYLQNTSL